MHPHGAYVRRARRNRIDPHGGEIERFATSTSRLGQQLHDRAEEAPVDGAAAAVPLGEQLAQDVLAVLRVGRRRGPCSQRRVALAIGTRLLRAGRLRAGERGACGRALRPGRRGRWGRQSSPRALVRRQRRLGLAGPVAQLGEASGDAAVALEVPDNVDVVLFVLDEAPDPAQRHGPVVALGVVGRQLRDGRLAQAPLHLHEVWKKKSPLKN